MENIINHFGIKIIMKQYKVEVNENGTIRWYNLDHELHREEGPAVEYVDGTKEWYRNGELHRKDGPAIERPDGSKEWYINGDELDEDEFKSKYAKKVKIKGVT